MDVLSKKFRPLYDRTISGKLIAHTVATLIPRLFLILCAFLISCTETPQSNCPAIKDPGLYVQPSVVQVFITDINGSILRSGTGAIASTEAPYGQIITTAKLVSDAQRIWIGFRGGTNNEALVKDTFPSADLALLTVIIPPDFPALRLVAIDTPIDTKVYSTGYLGDDYFTFESTINNTVVDSSGHTSYAMSSTTPSLINGGPVVTHCGELIAVVTQATEHNILASAVTAGHMSQNLQNALSISTRDFIEQGRERLYRGEHERAIEEFSRAIQLNPNDALAYHERGYTYSQLRKYERAIQDFTQAIQLDPFDASAYNYRGQVYSRLRDYEKAIRDFTQAIVESPADSYDHLLGLHERAKAYFDAENYSLAIGDYTQALTVENDHSLSQFGLAHTNLVNRGMSYHEIGNYSESIRDYTSAIELSPDVAKTYYLRALSYQKLENADLAQLDLTKARELGLQSLP